MKHYVIMRRRIAADTNGATSSIPADQREYPNGGVDAGFSTAPKKHSSSNGASSTLQTLTIVISFVVLVGLPIIVIPSMQNASGPVWPLFSLGSTSKLGIA